jgi:hypothetical protein
MSIPNSLITSIANPCTDPDGQDPAETLSITTPSIPPDTPADICRKKPSAIWLRHELPVQRNRTQTDDSDGRLMMTLIMTGSRPMATTPPRTSG